MGKYDITLNGLGYVLMRDAKGRLMSGAAREQSVDPFSNHLTEEKWQTATFTFGEGAGRRRYDNSAHYRWGQSVDTRSGRLMLGPRAEYTVGALDERLTYNTDPTARWISTHAAFSNVSYLAFQINPGAVNLRSFGLMVQRDTSWDYSAAVDFQVELWSDAANVPGAMLASANVPLRAVADEWLPDEDRWMSGDWFWQWVSLAEPGVACVAGTSYWIVVKNVQDPPLAWGYDAGTPITGNVGTSTNGVAWTVAVGHRPLMKVYSYYDEVDREIGDIVAFRGTVTHFPHPPGDRYRRVYAAVGPKVMYYDDQAGAWRNSKPNLTTPEAGFAGRVTGLCEYGGWLLAAQGGAGNFYGHAGNSAIGDWVAGDRSAYCWCVHDDCIWMAYGATIWVGKTGAPVIYWKAEWDGTTPGHTVGDDATPITAMCSHDGKLYCAKPEGIYRIDYPSGKYDKWYMSDCNSVLVVDFSQDRAGRPWMVSWQGGMYFPSSGGVYEWKNGSLDNIWQRYIDSGAEQLWLLRFGRRGMWRSCQPTPRGLLLTLEADRGAKSQLWHYWSGEWTPIAETTQSDADYGVKREVFGGIFLDSRGGGVGRLFWGCGARIARAVWPIWTDDVSCDETARYDWNRTGAVVYPTLGLDKPGMKKDWRKVRVISRNMDASDAEMVFWYMLDEIGWPGAFATNIDASPVDEIDFPAGTASYSLDLASSFESSVEDATKSPIVEAVVVYYQELPDTVRQWSYWIAGRDGEEARGGGATGRDAATINAELAALQELDEPFAFTDELGSAHASVRVMGVTRQDLSLYQDVGPEPGLGALAGFMVTLVEV